MTVRLRRAAVRDDAVLEEIERRCFPNGHWTAADFRGHDCVVAECEGRVGGFIVVQEAFGGDRKSLPERNILNLAVLPEFRGWGFARALLTEVLGKPGVYFLEVRESNKIARDLYLKCGFREVARRSHYYVDPDESAIVMRMERC